MFPISLAYAKTYGYQTFRAKSPLSSKDTTGMFMLSNFADVASVRDLLHDTIISLKKGPERKVDVGDFLKLDLEQQKKHVLKFGWMDKKGEDLVKIWKTRYCLLLDEPLGFVYFKHNIFEDKVPKSKFKARGFIPFADITHVIAAARSYDFKLITKAREWHFRCSSTEIREQWLIYLSTLLDAVKELAAKGDSKKDHVIELDKDSNAINTEKDPINQEEDTFHSPPTNQSKLRDEELLSPESIELEPMNDDAADSTVNQTSV
jgi:hypothetical protein